jgi:mono/diheme cytochrome c family protein
MSRPLAPGTAALTGALVAAMLAVAAGVSHAADAPTAAYPQGAATFQANCAVCHGPAGAGIPALAPPLAYPSHYAGLPEGRRQLAMTVLYGLFGDIAVEGKHYDFRMPDFARLDDATLAATLNFVVFDLDHAPPEVKPLEPGEIAAERAHPVDGTAVREHRKAVTPP